MGGVVWGDHPADDYFVESHGVKTPDSYWKVIIREDCVIAWIIPNSAEATRKRLDDYLVTVESLEELTGVNIPVEEYLKQEKPETFWLIPMGCDKS
jgi:endonuclease G